METTWMCILLTMALTVALITDYSTHRIPNWLTLGLLVAAVIAQGLADQWSGLLSALAGACVGLLCFLPLHIFGAMGAGDVKLMGAVGAVLGPQPALIAVLATLVFGGVIALVFVGLKGGLGQMARRYARMATLVAQRQPAYLAPASAEPAAQRIPYALAIASGALFALWSLA